mgnify:CR=1 FL=1
MELLKGNLYFITDEFFERVGDPYLKINYETSMRPHYFAVRDKKTALYPAARALKNLSAFSQRNVLKTSRRIPLRSCAFKGIQLHCFFRICFRSR